MIDLMLKKYFWDIDFETLEVGKDKKYIIERILELGDENATRWIFKNFSKEDILNALKNNRKISKKSLNFWNLFLK